MVVLMSRSFAYMNYDIYNTKQSAIFWLSKRYIDVDLNILIKKIAYYDLYMKNNSLFLIQILFDNSSNSYYIKVIGKPSNDSANHFNSKLNKLILLNNE